MADLHFEPRPADIIPDIARAKATQSCSSCRRSISNQEISGWGPSTRQEYTMSGLCFTCQYSVFARDDDGEPNCICDWIDVGVYDSQGRGMPCPENEYCPQHGSYDISELTREGPIQPWEEETFPPDPEAIR